MSEEVEMNTGISVFKSDNEKWSFLNGHGYRVPNLVSASVYVLLKENVPQYVGQSDSVFGRLYQHQSGNKIQFDEIVWFPLDSSGQAAMVEGALIEILSPQHNTLGKQISTPESAASVMQALKVIFQNKKTIEDDGPSASIAVNGAES